MSAKYRKKDDLDYELLHDYLYEKIHEDMNMLELTKDTLSREDYYLQKTRIIELEHQLLLIRNKNG